MSEDAATDQHVHLEVADGVAVLRMDRPKLNALNAAMQRRIGQLATECAERDDVAAVVLTGGERVFAAGADIVEMEQLGYADMVAHSGVLQGAFSAVARIPKPVVAAVNGYALGGGCELALCADVRIAAEDATLGQPEIKLGIIPGAGGTQRLARLVGPSRAKDLIFTGRFVGAAEALAIGLVDQVVPAAEVLPTALAWARQFVGGPRLALRAAKECVDRGGEVDLDSGLELERVQFAALFATEDRAAGMRSFVEHGPGQARFTGR
jgi:enoyl-CoA hydratase/carnithine racemase